ncbi:PrgI family protein [Clostridium akagii]|uniref:PrgI family protein n=1 Tax=Clostridium akagii TaxID=91623 RepID=UPI00047E4F28|nr:PrgI family protein [Clostridium akagii]
MRAKIPRDITIYKPKIIAGFNLRQIVIIAIVLVITIPLYIVCRKTLGDNTTGWVIMLIALPLLLFGWYEPQGMSFERYLFSIVWTYVTPRVRYFKIEDEMVGENNVSKKRGQKR